MVKLTRDRDSEGELVVMVEGRLDEQGAQDLGRLCVGKGVLDLSGLRGADRTGWDLLRSLKRSGWTAVGASLFVASVLEEAGS